MSNNKTSAAATRRKFLAGATVAGAAVVAPNVVKAQGPISMRWQSTGRRRTSSTNTRSISARGSTI